MHFFLFRGLEGLENYYRAQNIAHESPKDIY